MSMFEQNSIALFQIMTVPFYFFHDLPNKNVLPCYLLDIKYERFPQRSLTRSRRWSTHNILFGTRRACLGNQWCSWLQLFGIRAPYWIKSKKHFKYCSTIFLFYWIIGNTRLQDLQAPELLYFHRETFPFIEA